MLKTDQKYPLLCEECAGAFHDGLTAPQSHVIEVPDDAVPSGSAEIGMHFFCEEKCVEAYIKKLDAKYRKA